MGMGRYGKEIQDRECDESCGISWPDARRGCRREEIVQESKEKKEALLKMNGYTRHVGRPPADVAGCYNVKV